MSFRKCIVCVLSVVVFVNCSNGKKSTPLLMQEGVTDTPTIYIDEEGTQLGVVEATGPGAKVNEAELVREAWNKTAMNQELLKTELINGAICALSEKHYVGCYFAARLASEVVYGPETVLYPAGASPNEFIGEEVQRLKNFTVYKKALPLVDNDKKENDFFKETNAYMVEIYRRGIQERTDLDNRAIASVEGVKGQIDDSYRNMQAKVANVKSDDEYWAAKAEWIKNSLISEEVKAYKKTAQEIEADALSDIYQLIDQAFEKTAADRRAQLAVSLYNTYLSSSADPHAGFDLHPEVVRKIKAKTVKYGIGVRLIDDKGGVYANPLQDSAAIKAGILAGDRITHVDGVGITKSEEAVDKILGKNQTPVVITIERGTPVQVRKITVVRSPVLSLTYNLSIKNVGENAYGFLRIEMFDDEKMPEKVRSFVKENNDKVRGWILDLRSNPGGYVTAAVGLSSVFIPKGSVVMMESEDDDLDVIDHSSADKYATKVDAATQKPVVVLINHRSASASEIVAGTLQDLKRGVVVGTTTFGKGSMQTLPRPEHPDIPGYFIFADKFSVQGLTWKAAFKKTTNRYFLPSGRTPEWTGVSPDLEVQASPSTEPTWYAREKDLLYFSMPNIGTEWVQPRTAMVEKLKSCVGEHGRTKDWTAGKSSVSLNFDPAGYQVDYAMDVIDCDAPELASIK